MNNIEQLKKEQQQCKKNIVRFSVLTGVMLFLILLATIFYVVGLVIVVENAVNDTQLAEATVGLIVIYVLLMIQLCLAACIFVPFIVINGIKFGKRRRLIAKIEKDGVING